MRMRAALLGLVVAAGAASSAWAATATAPAPLTASDPKGDTKGALDVTRAAVARGQDGRVRFGITLAKAWTAGDLLAAKGPPGSLCVKAWTTSVPPDATPDFLVCVTADAQSALRGTVLRERPNQLPVRVGPATVSRPSRRTVTVRFAQSLVDRPAVLHAAGEATPPGCARRSCTDTAPNAPETLDLRLHAPTA
jgi:hypothetical protein